MTGTIASIQASAKRRAIRRLCHFTPSRNLDHIASDCRGVLATQHLLDDERSVFNPTDLERFDNHREHICCSIQYPNTWYFRKLRLEETLFHDWVVLLIRPHYLWRAGTKFSPCNSATRRGTLIREGADAFESLFAQRVEGRRTVVRSRARPAFAPTDGQAEVLIRDQVMRQDVIGIAVRDDSQARREISRLTILGMRSPPIIVAADFFDARALESQLSAGQTPVERTFTET